MFWSIKYKIMIMCLSAMLTLALCMGAVSVLSIHRLTGEHEAENLNRVAETQREIINTELIHVEDVTQFVANDVRRHVNDPREVQNRAFRKYVTENAGIAFQNAVGNFDVVCSYYVYYADEMEGEKENLWRVRKKNGRGFVDKPLPSITSYAADDKPHINWYKLPVQSGKPLWIPPYYYEEQQRYLLSYVIPVFKDDTLVAVVGADLDFQQFLMQIGQLSDYAYGQAFLTDLTGRTHYTVDNPDGIESTRGGQLTLDQEEAFVLDTPHEELMRYCWNGEKYDMAAVSLRNGLALLVAAPVHEIYADARLKVVHLGVVFLLLGLFFALVCHMMSRRMTQKIVELTTAANELAAGNWQAAIPNGGSDEIGALCRAFAYSVEQLRKTKAELEYQSYHDGLTGLYNRKGLDKMLKEWWPEAERAVMIILDIDDFKFINDLYGHPVGDEVLKKLARLLNSYFGDIGFVGRNGGDEFVVVLREKSIEDVEKRIADFCRLPKYYALDGGKKEFFVSAGVAVYPEGAADLKNMFKQADEALYGVKIRGKNGYHIYDAKLEHQLPRNGLGFNLNSISKNLPAAILIYKLDQHDTLLYASEAMLKLSGDDSLEAMQQRIGGSVLALVRDSERESFHQDSEESEQRIYRYQLQNSRGEQLNVELCRSLENHPLYGKICYAVMVKGK